MLDSAPGSLCPGLLSAGDIVTENLHRPADAARRIADEMTMHAIMHAEGWAAFRLSDGSALDHVAYERRTDAVRAAGWDRDRVMYLEIQPDGMTIQAADACLRFARILHDAGFRIPSPEFEYDPTMPLLAHDRLATIRHLSAGARS